MPSYSMIICQIWMRMLLGSVVLWCQTFWLWLVSAEKTMICTDIIWHGKDNMTQTQTWNMTAINNIFLLMFYCLKLNDFSVIKQLLCKTYLLGDNTWFSANKMMMMILRQRNLFLTNALEWQNRRIVTTYNTFTGKSIDFALPLKYINLLI